MRTDEVMLLETYDGRHIERVRTSLFHLFHLFHLFRL